MRVASGTYARLLSIALAGTAATGCGAQSTEVVVPGADLTAGFQQASWGSNVTVTYADGRLRFVSNGIPNHARDAQYAVATSGGLPTASNSVAVADPTRAQTYDYSIPLTPTKAAATTPTSLGVIGVMISGASLFNPYEGDGVTVATQSNFSVSGTGGTTVWFLDSCNGHPTPMMGTYHYHALPKCVTAVVDGTSGPSHIIGIAFDPRHQRCAGRGERARSMQRHHESHPGVPGGRLPLRSARRRGTQLLDPMLQRRREHVPREDVDAGDVTATWQPRFAGGGWGPWRARGSGMARWARRRVT